MAASAGGVEALRGLVADLPANLPAALFVVLHIPPVNRSHLAEILSRAGSLPAIPAVDGQPIRLGTIVVAPPDRHLLLEPGRVRLTRGPRENGHRPAADVLFRGAAIAYAQRVVGVVLSGTQDDGAAGLAVIKRFGGLAVVQDPREALYSGMPQSSLDTVGVDYCLPVQGIAALLTRLAGAGATELTEAGSMPGFEQPQLDPIQLERQMLQAESQLGTPSVYTCPECHGTLWQVDEGELARFRCRVGHAYSAEHLLTDQNVSVEAALWTALRTLEERAQLGNQMAARAADRGLALAAKRFAGSAQEAEQNAAVLRQLLLHGKPRADQDDSLRPAS